LVVIDRVARTSAKADARISFEGPADDDSAVVRGSIFRATDAVGMSAEIGLADELPAGALPPVFDGEGGARPGMSAGFSREACGVDLPAPGSSDGGGGRWTIRGRPRGWIETGGADFPANSLAIFVDET
jgi:hypothetical protein